MMQGDDHGAPGVQPPLPGAALLQQADPQLPQLAGELPRHHQPPTQQVQSHHHQLREHASLRI